MPDENMEKKLEEYVKETEQAPNSTQQEKEHVGPKIIEAPAPKFPHQIQAEEKISRGNQTGWQKIPMQELPTKGMFYPPDANIVIRAATTAEIRHWSTLDDSDPYELDDMLNYVLERCASFKTSNVLSSWKDLKEVDRFYILLAISEYTFVQGENKLQVKVSEGKTINVSKEMMDFINIDDRLMKYYDSNKRCFSLKFKSGKTVDVTIPSVGVTTFLKNYVTRKQNSNDGFDQDFISFAPFVVNDWRGLNDSSYEKLVLDSYRWSIEEISVLNHVKELFLDTINPVIKYTDEGGAERTAPLNFLGGIKSVFIISDPFGQLV